MFRKFFTVILLSTIALGTSAQGQTVSLDSCRNMALRTNKALKMADAGIEGAGYARKAARAAYLPAVDLSAGYMYNQHKVNLLGEDAKLPTMTFNPLTGKYDYNILMNPTTGQPVTDPASGSPIPLEVAVIPKEAMSYDIHNVMFGTVSLTQPVYMGGAIRAMNEITKYAELLAQSTRDAAVQELIYAVDESYWTVVSLESKQKLAESYLQLVDTLQRNVNAMLKEGVATRSDSLRVAVLRNEAALTLTKVDNGLSLSRMALAQICGQPIDAQLRPQDCDLNAVDNMPGPVDYTMDQVYASRPELETMRHSISIAEQKARLAKAAMLPKVSVIGSYTFMNPNTINGFENRFGGNFSVGAALTMPLWHWGGNYYTHKAAKAETTIQKLALAEAEDKIELQVNQAKFKYDEAYKTYNTTRTNLLSADENLRQARLGFKEGVMTLQDVMTAQTGWLAAHSEEIDAQIGVQLCNVYLAKVLGRLK